MARAFQAVSFSSFPTLTPRSLTLFFSSTRLRHSKAALRMVSSEEVASGSVSDRVSV